MNEKELQEITEKIERTLYLYSPIPITTIKEIVDQLIAEVRQLRKPLIVSSTIKKLADENKLYKDLYTKENTQNMVYKVALKDLDNCLDFNDKVKYEGFWCGLTFVDANDYNKAIIKANKALEVDTNERNRRTI